MRLNKEQRKYLAGVIEKASIAYFAVFGYTWISKGEWVLVLHALIAFAVFQLPGLVLLAGIKEKSDEP
jgi:hypothetical protein